jgi:hypothetical protein
MSVISGGTLERIGTRVVPIGPRRRGGGRLLDMSSGMRFAVRAEKKDAHDPCPISGAAGRRA